MTFPHLFVGFTASQRRRLNVSCSFTDLSILILALILGLLFISPPQLEVLHLLSPAQKAELLMMPEVAGLDNGTLTLVFHNLLTGNPGPLPINMTHNWTTPSPLSVYSPPPPHNDFREVSQHGFTDSDLYCSSTRAIKDVVSSLTGYKWLHDGFETHRELRPQLCVLHT